VKRTASKKDLTDDKRLILRTGISEDLLEKILSAIENNQPLTPQMQEALTMVLNSVRDDDEFYVEYADSIELAENSKGFKKRKALIKKGILIEDGGFGLFRVKDNLSKAEAEQLEWFHIDILNMLFPQLLSKTRNGFVSKLQRAVVPGVQAGPVISFMVEKAVYASRLNETVGDLTRAQVLAEQIDKNREALVNRLREKVSILDSDVTVPEQGMWVNLDLGSFGELTRAQAEKILSSIGIDIHDDTFKVNDEDTVIEIGLKGPTVLGFDEDDMKEFGDIIVEAFDPFNREGDDAIEDAVVLKLIERVTALAEKHPIHKELRDAVAAASSPIGGIDLNANHLDLNAEGQIMNTPLPVNLQNFNNTPFDGFAPVIFEIVPISNFPLRLGFGIK